MCPLWASLVGLLLLLFCFWEEFALLIIFAHLLALLDSDGELGVSLSVANLTLCGAFAGY
jgi:hypothetical protein